MRLGIVGLGRMGAAISSRLRQQGFDVTGWDQNAKANEAMATDGLRIAANARGVAAVAEVVISSITEDHGVRKIFTGAAGFLEGDVKGKLFIEMSTLQPMTGRELKPLVEARGARLIEAPVLGTIPQVQAGTLFAMVGGAAEDLDRAKPVLEKLTRRIVHMGPNGSGYAMKLSDWAPISRRWRNRSRSACSKASTSSSWLTCCRRAPPHAAGSRARPRCSRATRAT